nr:MAG TPA: hypothetical protein [Bacteriophage sp.]
MLTRQHLYRYIDARPRVHMYTRARFPRNLKKL